MIELGITTASVVSGVVLRSLFFISPWCGVFLLLMGCFVFVYAWLRERRVAYILAAGCIACGLGILRVGDPAISLPPVFAHDLHHRVTYAGVVHGQSEMRDDRERVPILVEKSGAEAVLLASVSRAERLVPGDRVEITGTLLLPEPFVDERRRWFAYDQYLARDDITLVMPYASLTLQKQAPWYHPLALLARIKNTFIDGMVRALPEPHASLASGIVIGGKFGLGKSIKDDFTRSGLIQIIVLSGYNIMIIAEWLLSLLSRTNISKRVSAIIAGTALIIFVGIAGASATALRALLMASIALYARTTGKTYVAGRALLVTVIILALYNPRLVVYDPGFRLSVAATAGLLWLTPLYEIMLSRISLKTFREILSTTLAAQTGVLPLLLYTTGLLSLSALPATLLTTPVIPLAMATTFIAGIFGVLIGPFLPLFAIAIGFPAYLATSFLLAVAHLFARIPGAVYTLPPLSAVVVLGAYGALIYCASSKRFSTMLQLRFAKKASI